MTVKFVHRTLTEKDRFFHGAIHLLVVIQAKTITVDAPLNPITPKLPSSCDFQ